jgi:DNA repair protein RecN (Recombination protein N)
VLNELIVENLLLIERAELRLGPGLNVLTGETGAGKTMLAHALDLLLGGKARAGIVRPGASEAYVEGAFDLVSGLELPEDASELVLARRVWPDGRTRAYVCGRAATVADLREIGGKLISFYGQHEHRKLMLASSQLDVLDAHCGGGQLERRARMAALHGQALALQARVAELRELAGARERELDLLEFELREIDDAAIDPAEQESLVLERDRLRSAEALRSAAAGGASALAPEDGEDGVASLLAAAARGIEPLSSVDPVLGALGTRVSSLAYEAADLAAELWRYAGSVESSPERLEAVEERLALLARLERKHGGSLEAVLEYAERCRARRAQLQDAEILLEEGGDELSEALALRDAVALELRDARSASASVLAEAVHARLAELAMPDARFEVRLSARDGGCGPRGADSVEMMIAPNPGVPSAPLRESASGGELSRVMLALLSAAHAEAGPLLVFDEIDAGIGGHTARAVGEHLRDLAAGRQVLCITHLPQVASLGQRHFRISKSGATTSVVELAGDRVVGELVRMLGADEGDRAAGRVARQLMKAA